MAESDLYPPIKRYLEAQGYAVKGEVRECDVVARRGDEAPLIVELKASFSLQLLLQGVDRQTMSDAVYLACPAPKRRALGDILKLCRRLGLGVLIVEGDIVTALADPLPYRPRQDKRRKGLLLKEFERRQGDTEAGGSRPRPRMTAYRQDALRLVKVLHPRGPSPLALLRQESGVLRAASLLQNDVYGWFQRESRGVYALSPKGAAAVDIFAGALAQLAAPAP